MSLVEMILALCLSYPFISKEADSRCINTYINCSFHQVKLQIIDDQKINEEEAFNACTRIYLK